MEFTAMFLGLCIVMFVAWRGGRIAAIGLFGLALAAAIATLVHHATDALKLSF